VISWPVHPPTAGPISGGINMLLPVAYDVEWTGLQEVFNDYPPPPPTVVLPTNATPDQVAAATASNQASAAAQSRGSNGRHSVTVAIAGQSVSGTAILPSNPKRVSLILQNNSTATTSGDVAPVLWFNFNTQAQVNYSIGLAPGTNGLPGDGLVLDQNVSADSLYVTVGPFSNGGGSVVIAGSVIDNSEGPPPPPPGGIVPWYVIPP
jgi:hypothetical protein